MNDAERIARKYIDIAEEVGAEIAGVPTPNDETWEWDDLTQVERTGLKMTIQRMLDRGIIAVGTDRG